MKAVQRSIRFNPELDHALKFWHEKTGIPINRLVREGTITKIKELEKIYGLNDKERG